MKDKVLTIAANIDGVSSPALKASRAAVEVISADEVKNCGKIEVDRATRGAH